MEITRRTDYAIRIMLALAATDGTPLSVREIATRQGIPYPFARRIQRSLVLSGLARSQRGASGGLVLSRPASDISLLDIIEAIEGPISLNVCTRDPEWCERMHICTVHPVWQEASGLLKECFGGVSLAGLADGEE